MLLIAHWLVIVFAVRFVISWQEISQKCQQIRRRITGAVSSWQRLTITARSTWLFALRLRGQTIIDTIGRK